MIIWSVSLHPIYVSARRNVVKKLLCYLSLAWFSVNMLAGCQQMDASSRFARDKGGLEATASNDHIMDCQQVWQEGNVVILHRTNYWLRAMTCAGQLDPQHARIQADNLSVTTDWSYRLMRDILLLKSTRSLIGQQRILAQFVRHQTQSPTVLHPLLQLWHDNQVNRIGWLAEQQRTQQLESSLDYQHEEQRRLQSRLGITTQKLENLTEIERQLSTRKPINSESAEPTTSYGENGGHK